MGVFEKKNFGKFSENLEVYSIMGIMYIYLYETNRYSNRSRVRFVR